MIDKHTVALLRQERNQLDTEKGVMGQEITRLISELSLVSQKNKELDREHATYPWWVKFLPRGIPIPGLPIDRAAVTYRVCIIVGGISAWLLITLLLLTH